MELKTILAIGLVVFIVGAFDLPEDQSQEEVSLGAAKTAAPFTYPENRKGGKNYGSFL